MNVTSTANRTDINGEERGDCLLSRTIRFEARATNEVRAPGRLVETRRMESAEFEIEVRRKHLGIPRMIPGKASKPQWLEESIAYMLEHLDQPLRADTLARRAGVSASYFFTLFKRATGFSPIDFFIRARMAAACELLVATALPVKDIAMVLGYEDALYFSRRFKLTTGAAPSEYRQSAHQDSLQPGASSPADS